MIVRTTTTFCQTGANRDYRTKRYLPWDKHEEMLMRGQEFLATIAALIAAGDGLVEMVKGKGAVNSHGVWHTSECVATMKETALSPIDETALDGCSGLQKALAAWEAAKSPARRG